MVEKQTNPPLFYKRKMASFEFISWQQIRGKWLIAFCHTLNYRKEQITKGVGGIKI